MTWFRDIQPLAELGDVGADDSGRAQFAFSVVATSRRSDTFVEELLEILQEAQVGTRGLDLLGSSLADIPKAPAPGALEDFPFLVVRATGGPAPLGTHDGGRLAYRQATALVIARAKTSPAANALAQRALEALVAVRAREVEP